MPKSKATVEEFVLIYLEQGGVVENIANKIGVGTATVRQRVKKLRKAGVRLPIERKTKSYDVKALNNLIREFKRSR